MKTFTITYKSSEDVNGLFVGSGSGENENEAINDFMGWHGSECLEIVSVKEYK